MAVQRAPARQGRGAEIAMADYTVLDLKPSLSSLAEDVRTGLTAEPKSIPPKHFYDERGSMLFNEITRLPEYYLSRTEASVLSDYGEEIAESIGASSLIELGSGSFDKIRCLLPFLSEAISYTPVDISLSALHDTAARVKEAVPAMQVFGVCADYTKTMSFLNSGRNKPAAVFFLGSTIGNLDPKEASEFLQKLASQMNPEDSLVVGVDLKKDPVVLHRAYNDEAGITASFNKNLLHRLNRELDAGINTGHFEHEAFYNERLGRIEMHLRAEKPSLFSIGGETFTMRAGETIHTENSRKFTPDEFMHLARQSSWETNDWWTDENEWFGVFTLSPRL